MIVTVQGDDCNNARDSAIILSKMADFAASGSFIQSKFFRTVAAAQHNIAPLANHPAADRSGGVAGLGLFVGINAHWRLAAVDDVLIDDDLDHIGEVG